MTTLLYSLWLFSAARAEGSERLDILDLASGSGATAFGAIAAGQSALTLDAPQDFRNGQGILITGAGAGFGGAAPRAASASVTGTGATAYTYYVSTCDPNGGIGAAVSIDATASSTLDPNNFVTLQWNGNSGTGCWLVWSNSRGGGEAFLGSTSNPNFTDQGQLARPKPYWVPAAHATSAINDWLVTTVSAGGGTASLTLAVPAGNSISGASTACATTAIGCVLHDDTAAWNGAIGRINASGGTLHIPGMSPQTGTPVVIRISSPPNTITQPVHIVQEPNAVIAPAGAEIQAGQPQAQAQAVYRISGPGGAGPLQSFSAPLTEGTLGGTLSGSASACTSGMSVGQPVLIYGTNPANLDGPRLITDLTAMDGCTIGWEDAIGQTLTAAKAVPLSLLSRVSVEGARCDGSNLVGGNNTHDDGLRLDPAGGISYGCLFIQDAAHPIVRHLRTAYLPGSAVNVFAAREPDLADIEDTGSGDQGVSAIQIDWSTKITARALHATTPNGFGIGHSFDSYFSVSDLACRSAQTGRCIKFNAAVKGSIYAPVAQGGNSTGLAFAGSSYDIDVYNPRISGYKGFSGNAVGLWLAGQNDTKIRVYDLVAVDNAVDVFVAANDALTIFGGRTTDLAHLYSLDSSGTITAYSTDGCPYMRVSNGSGGRCLKARAARFPKGKSVSRTSGAGYPPR